MKTRGPFPEANYRAPLIGIAIEPEKRRKRRIHPLIFIIESTGRGYTHSAGGAVPWRNPIGHRHITQPEKKRNKVPEVPAVTNLQESLPRPSATVENHMHLERVETLFSRSRFRRPIHRALRARCRIQKIRRLPGCSRCRNREPRRRSQYLRWPRYMGAGALRSQTRS